MTETLLETIILQAPNVTVALAALWWAGRTIDKLVVANEAQQTILLEMIDRVIRAEKQLNDQRLASE